MKSYEDTILNYQEVNRWKEIGLLHAAIQKTDTWNLKNSMEPKVK